MNISYRKAIVDDIELLIQIYNESFYDDYIRYGECPGYGRSYERMKDSLEKLPKTIIMADDKHKPVGVISLKNKGNGEYYLGCLAVIPPYQHKGIGSTAIKYIMDTYADCKELTLITPEDKIENVCFYTKKCGFIIDGSEMDGNVKVSHFVLYRDR